jgi:hypothetical protein
MEEDRLKVMPDDYNLEEFEALWKETENLRKSLARGIDATRLGLSPEEVYAEFTVKFIFAFQKYHEQFTYDVLKGHIIRALQFYKIRLLKVSSTQRYETVRNSDPIDDYLGLFEAEESSERDEKLDRIVEYMRTNLSRPAFLIFCIDLEPPIKIKSQMESLRKKPHSKIPAELVAEYLEWGSSKEAIQRISQLRAEVKKEIALASEYFQGIGD